MESQGQTPQQAPDMVAMAVMGLLVGQDMAEGCLILCCFRCEVDSRTEQTEKAGRGQTLCRIDRQEAPSNLQGPSELLKLPGKTAVRADQN